MTHPGCSQWLALVVPNDTPWLFPMTHPVVPNGTPWLFPMTHPGCSYAQGSHCQSQRVPVLCAPDAGAQNQTAKPVFRGARHPGAVQSVADTSK